MRRAFGTIVVRRISAIGRKAAPRIIGKQLWRRRPNCPPIRSALAIRAVRFAAPNMMGIKGGESPLQGGLHPLGTDRQICRSPALLGEALIALAAAEQVSPHGAPRCGNVGAFDRGGNSAMLGLDALQIGPQLFAAREPDADALPRNEKTAEEFEKAHEMRIFGRSGDRLMKSEIFVDRALAARQRRVDRRERAGNAPARSDACPFGGETRRFDFDPSAQLHYLNDLRDRAQAVGIDTERAALDIAHDEGA